MNLTPQMLRDAALLLSVDYEPNTDGLNRFMCHAVEDVSPMGSLWEVCEEFAELLDEHEVDVAGSLHHRGINYAGDLPHWRDQHQAQCLRFDFLNLLACELEAP